jgi:hypothetical protein
MNITGLLGAGEDISVTLIGEPLPASRLRRDRLSRASRSVGFQADLNLARGVVLLPLLPCKGRPWFCSKEPRRRSVPRGRSVPPGLRGYKCGLPWSPPFTEAN